MRIVLSAHFDIATPVPFITIKEGAIEGLVDNIAGVLVAWEAHKKTGVPLYLTNFEETGLPTGRQGFKGAREVAKQLVKTHNEARGARSILRCPAKRPLSLSKGIGLPEKLDARPQRRTESSDQSARIFPLVIVVDTTRDAKGKAAYIGNIYNLDLKKLPKKLTDQLFIMPRFFEETEDETWVYGHKFGFPSFYFGVPIPHAKVYHDTKNVISLSTLHRSATILIRILSFLTTKAIR